MYETIEFITRHIAAVKRMIKSVTSELEHRGDIHDLSKFEEDEFVGYQRFEALPKGLEYGSEEYQQALQVILKDNESIKIHTERNQHHPEFWGDNLESMEWMDIVEMVCDWAGAHVSYGNEGDWWQTVEHNINRWEFTEPQIWLIRQVAESLWISDLGSNEIPL